MKDRSVSYYKQGHNCSQCVLKAAEFELNLPISKQCHMAAQGINTGFGVCSTCSVIVAGIMLFGLKYDAQTVKRLRMELLDRVSKKYGGVNCCELKSGKNDSGCENIISGITEIIDDIIRSNR